MGSAIEEFERREHRTLWIRLALVLGLIVVFTPILDLLFQGIPLGFEVPLINKKATVSNVTYYATVFGATIIIGFIGLRELLLERKFSIEFLMAAAATGALYLGFLFEAATVLLLYSIAEFFEGYIEDRARKTVEKLSHFMLDKAQVITAEGKEETVDVKDVMPGSIVLVKPGERIAVDGIVVNGISHINQSLVTGESALVLKKAGDIVYAGTLNTSGLLKIVVNKKAENTLVSRIVKLVIQSRKRKASIEKLVDRFAKFYVPIVVSFAIITAFVIPAISAGSFEAWLYRALILLVISCPSAFVISVPATLFTAVTIAARKGAIVKGGIYIEKMDKIQAVLFDKTGTLTLGEPTVHCVKGEPESDEEALLFAAALEQFSNHPLAQAIVKKANAHNLNFKNLDVQEVNEIPGKGITGLVNGIRVVVGSMDLLLQYGCDCEYISETYMNEKHSAVCVSLDKKATSSICIFDETRNDASQTVRVLKKAGLYTAILTGDKTEIAKEMAQTLDVNDIYAELFPEDKLRIITRTKETYGLVAMVGDGINDAPALAASDVGIAMGGAKVDAAMDSADIILVNDELTQIPALHALSKKTMRIAKQNITLSIAVKLVLGAFGLVGLVPLWFTVASGDDGLTMLTLLNTLRLARSPN